MVTFLEQGRVVYQKAKLKRNRGRRGGLAGGARGQGGSTA